jgi:predicted glutamine amidotransferase
VPAVCRLFGMNGGAEPVQATFWLLEAPDSLAEQSRRNPDGFGLGTFDETGAPEVVKGAVAAHDDEGFARQAREETSCTFNAHVRFRSTGPVAFENTHPFVQEGRLFGHNGVIDGLPALEDRLGDHMRLVEGETDSERLFALITKETEAAGGDLGTGIETAVRWVVEHLPVYSLNFVLTTEHEVWALRYPEHNPLLVLWRGAGGPSGERQLDHASAAGTVRVRAAELSERPAVVVASERMDEDPGWRPLWSGELLRIDAQLRMQSSIVLPTPPRHPLDLEKLGTQAAASQEQG